MGRQIRLNQERAKTDAELWLDSKKERLELSTSTANAFLALCICTK